MSEVKPSLYTKIWNGIIPETPVYRNDDHGIMVLLDAFPATRGHVNVVPAEQVRTWDKLPAHRFLEVMAVAHAFGNHLMRELSPPPERPLMDIYGHGIEHVHVHIIPSYQRDDSANIQIAGRPRLTADQVAELSETLSVTPQFLEEAELALSAIRTVES